MKIRSLLCGLIFLGGASAAESAVLITFNGTISSSDITRFSEGDAFELTFTLPDYSITGNPSRAANTPDLHSWSQAYPGAVPIQSNVEFTGSEGSFVNPATPDIYLNVGLLGSNTSTYLGFYLDLIGNANMGLQIDGEMVKSIAVEARVDGVLDGLYESLDNPGDFYMTILGTNQLFKGENFKQRIVLSQGEVVNFILTSVTVTAIPEPSTYIMFGMAATALLPFLRRGRRQLIR